MAAGQRPSLQRRHVVGGQQCVRQCVSQCAKLRHGEHHLRCHLCEAPTFCLSAAWLQLRVLGGGAQDVVWLVEPVLENGCNDSFVASCFDGGPRWHGRPSTGGAPFLGGRRGEGRLFGGLPGVGCKVSDVSDLGSIGLPWVSWNSYFGLSSGLDAELAPRQHAMRRGWGLHHQPQLPRALLWS